MYTYMHTQENMEIEMHFLILAFTRNNFTKCQSPLLKSNTNVSM